MTNLKRRRKDQEWLVVRTKTKMKKKRKSTFQAVPLTESHDQPILKREDEPKKEKKGSRTVSSWNENEKEKKSTF